MILIFTVDYYPDYGSGIANYTFNLTKSLHRLGEDVLVLTPHISGDREFDRLQGFRTIRFTNVPLLRELVLLFILPVIIKKFKVKKIVNLMWAPCGILSLFFKGIFNVPYIVTAFGCEIMENLGKGASLSQHLKGKLMSLKYKTFRHADRVISISNWTKELLVKQGIEAEKIHVLYGGVDMDEFKNKFISRNFKNRDSSSASGETQNDKRRCHSERSEESNFVTEELIDKYGLKGKRVILTVTRLDDYKGVDKVLNAMPRVLKKFPEAFYLVVGDGPDKKRLNGLVATLGLIDRARLGVRVSREEVIELMKLCEIFILATRPIIPRGEVEGFGIVFAEAGALGKPVIGGISGGTVEAVKDGVTGLLVDPESTEDISNALLKLLKDPDYAKRLGENGRKRVEEELNWDVLGSRARDIIYGYP